MHCSKGKGLFDHLVGGREQRQRHSEAEHPGGLGVDDEFELRCLHDRQVHRFCTLENAAGVDADLAVGVPQVCSVAHESADFGKFAQREYRGDAVERRQEAELNAPAHKKAAAGNKKRVRPLVDETCEGCVDLAIGASPQNASLQPDGDAGRLVNSRSATLLAGSPGLMNTAMQIAFGTRACKSSNRFALSSVDRMLTPVTLPPGWARLATRPSLTGSSAVLKTMGSAVVAALAASGACAASGRDNETNPPTNQFGGHGWQSLCLIVGPAIFYRQVFTLNIAGFFETLTQSAHRLRQGFGRGGIEKSDHWHCRLLRPRHERPSRRRGSEKANELTSPHIRTQFRGQHCIGLNVYFDRG